MDLQAQDRAHRIGQTKPVLVYRLVSAHTIETRILQKAGNKRKLEALVISQGKFGRVVDENGRVLLGRSKQTQESMAGMAKALLDLEGEEINVASAGDTIISDEDLEVLLDRSKEAFAREKGWSAGLGKGNRAEQIKKGERTAFEVSHPPRVVTGENRHADTIAGIRICKGRGFEWAGHHVRWGWRDGRKGRMSGQFGGQHWTSPGDGHVDALNHLLYRL